MSIKDIYNSILKRNDIGERKEKNLLYELKGSVKVVRKVGEEPNKDRTSFSKYFCDLCGRSYVISSLVQCNICGRWICRENCLSNRYGICSSCDGVLQLLLDSREYYMNSSESKSNNLKNLKRKNKEGDTNGRRRRKKS